MQGSEPSYLERAEQMHRVMCSTMEKVGGAVEKGKAEVGGAAPWGEGGVDGC